MYYVLNHKESFENLYLVMMVSLMKFCIEFITHLAALILMATIESVYELLGGFVGVIFIGELDEIYFKSIKSNLKQKLIKIDF